MTRKAKRLTIIGAMGTVLALAAVLVASALRERIVFFYTPSELTEGASLAPGTRVRLGGLVESGSLARSGETVTFAVTDTARVIAVRYTGILPDLFREGQGVVAEGRVGADGVFTADTVLARHDENYMPREVADALKAKGVWKEGEAMPPASVRAQGEGAPAPEGGTR